MINLLNLIKKRNEEVPWKHCHTYVDMTYNPEQVVETPCGFEFLPATHIYHIVFVYNRQMSNGRWQTRENKHEITRMEYLAMVARMPVGLMPKK